MEILGFNFELVCSVVSGIQPSIQPRQANTSKPTSPWVTFPALMFTLAKFLPPPKMLLIVKSHNEFRVSIMVFLFLLCQSSWQFDSLFAYVCIGLIAGKEDFASTADTESEADSR